MFAFILALLSALVVPRPAVSLDPAAAEVVRVQRHFDGALAMLRARDVSLLSPEARAKRERLIAELVWYQARGQFPHNYDFPDERVPYFVDERTGVHCAVGHLLAVTGRHDLVAAVSAANNNVRVAQLADNAEFRAWLDDHGLTLAEAARIQPTYFPIPPAEPEYEPNGPALARNGAAIAGSLGLSMLSTFNTGARSSRRVALAGYTMSALAFATAATTWDARGARPTALVTIAVGGVGLITASNTYARAMARDASAESALANLVDRARLGPYVTPTGQTGLILSLRF